MGYLQTFGEQLASMLEVSEVPRDEREAIVAFARDAVLESYRNGQAAGAEPKRARGKRTSEQGKRRVREER